MNYINNQDYLKLKQSKVAQLSDSVGDFIRYWGFRRIHGQIWTLVYLSKVPLSGSELVDLLSVSKALVSPAIKELEDEGLIIQIKSENSKTKRYKAVEDVEKVIKGVLRRREKPMMDKVYKSFSDLDAHIAAIDQNRLVKIGKMITQAQMLLTMLTETDELWN